jgi:membrane-bound lytic murein transglycosylase D
LFKLILVLCLAVGTFAPSAQAENQLALSTALADSDTFIVLDNARNIPLRLLTIEEVERGDLWQRLRGGFLMQDINSPLVAHHEQWYAKRPDYIARMMVRASRYLFYITSEVERRGMPSEIALLPMIESAFNPGANSTSSAAGIWQFMPATGKNFGMRQNWWYDGRRDVIGATTGALDYLEKLHNQFGDWELALAAYNWGEGSVQRAQERNRKLGLPTNYVSLKMPDETRNYVPKLLAIKNIIANPSVFGLELPEIKNKAYFAAVSSAKHIDLELAAQFAGISKEEFVALNPAHNRPVMLQNNNDYILLPIDKIEAYQTNLESYDKPLVSWQVYHTQKGENLAHLAPRFGLSLEKLKSVNSLSARNDLSTGDTLLVPLNGDPIDTEEETAFEEINMHLHPVRREATGSASIKYVAHSGDTLDKLASRYHVSVASLKSWNGHLKHLKTGQTLTIVQGEHEPKLGKTTRHAKAASHESSRHKARRTPATSKPAKRVHRAYLNR